MDSLKLNRYDERNLYQYGGIKNKKSESNYDEKYSTNEILLKEYRILQKKYDNLKIKYDELKESTKKS